MINNKLVISPARRHFKKRIGQVNHFLITTLIGLDGVKNRDYKLPKEFSTSWNPKNIERSVERSARFVLDASLSWVVDNLDSYFIESYRKPSIIESEDLRKAYSKADRSVSKRFDIFYEETLKRNKEIQKYAALVALSIQWRNNIVHFGAENELERDHLNFLKQNKELYSNEFHHLDINTLLVSFNSKDGHPSFKEVTSMIYAIHKYVECVDNFLLSNINIDRYITDLCEKHFETFKRTKTKVNNFTEDRKKNFYETLLRQYGFQLDEMY